MKTVGQKIVEGNSTDNILQEYYLVYKLGIQAPPASEFTINDSGTITMGSSGIYELDLSNLGGQIFSLVFNKLNGQAIVDMVYERKE